MDISYSRSAVARGCLKKYYWKYVENIEPIRQSSSLVIGNVVHDSGFDWKEHWKEMPGATYGMNYGSRKNGSWNRVNRRALGTIGG